MEPNNSFDHGRIMSRIYYVQISTFVFGPMILSGLIGNVISFFTWGKLTHQNSLTYLFRALAVIDCCLLLGLMLQVTVDFLSYYVDGGQHNAADVLWPYIRAYIHPLVFMALLANILTSMSIGLNRYIVVCIPTHAKWLCTTSHAKKQMIFIVLFSVLILLPIFFECEVGKTADGSTYIADKLMRNKSYIYVVRIAGFLIGGSLIPSCVLLFFCVRIIAALCESRRQPMDRIGDPLREIRVTSMVLVLLGIVLVCHCFWWIHFSCVFFLPNAPDKKLWLDYSWSCSNGFLILNSSVNCLIYSEYSIQFRRTLCCHQSTTQQDVELTWYESYRNVGQEW